MSSDSAATYAITRIRLINWHNFVYETVEVSDGGHLFLIGDNGSGKTTVLDAAHYVLTAGENLEFNSAARVAGARTPGRRPQGVVMRYNVETGPLNPAGGVSYAALEIKGRNGKPTIYAVGLEVYAMNEQIRRWGIIRECSLEDIPLCRHDEEGALFPASRQDIRDHFQASSGYYANIESYKREVARRLFRDETAFREIAHLLSMGKAYREIASHSGDYHELFKRLLPEPQPDIFERIVSALNSLDQSKSDLEALEEQLGYVQGLEQLVTGVAERREETSRLHWIEAKLEQAENQDHRSRTLEQIAERNQQLASFEEERKRLRAAIEGAEQTIADLQAKDSDGLVRRERELTDELRQHEERLEQAAAGAKRATGALKDCRRELSKRRKETSEALRRLFQETSRIAPKLPCPIGDLVASLDAAHRSEQPETTLENIGIEAARQPLEEQRQAADTEIGRLDSRREQAADRVQLSEKKLTELRGQQDWHPDIPNYPAALKALREAMVGAIPLYEGLEWQPDVPDTDKAAIEETIGPDVLSTFVVQGNPEELDEAATLVYRFGPNLRVAGESDFDDIPAWIREKFDLTRSDSQAVRCLAEEMLSRVSPEVRRIESFSELRFRAHRRRLESAPARFIGQQTRREARERRIVEIEEDRKQANSELRTVERDLKSAQNRRENLAAALDVLAQGEKELHRHAAAIRTQDVETRNAELRAEERQGTRVEAEAALKRCRERLEAVTAKVQAEGLDTLEKQMTRATANKTRHVNALSKIDGKVGEAENQKKGLEQRQRQLEEEGERLQQLVRERAQQILSVHPDIEDLDDFVLRECGGKRITTLDRARTELERVNNEETAAAAKVEERIRDIRFGPTFVFAYDSGANELLDRRQRPIAAIVEALEKQVAEQRELINERTRELFRKLIVGELLTHLRGKIEVMRNMVRQINRQLEKRPFGTSTYRFELHSVDRYAQLVKLVEKYNPWQADIGEDELRQFFEDHREAITSAEVGTIPELLDYRNWFHYDMRLRSTDGDGVVIDPHTKSIGSGGEQAVPNYLLILTVAHFMLSGNSVPLRCLLFDEAFYGIDAGRRDQILGFASDLGLQLFVASPDQDGVRQEVPNSTTILVVKDDAHDVHLYPFDWENPRFHHAEMLADPTQDRPLAFQDEL